MKLNADGESVDFSEQGVGGLWFQFQGWHFDVLIPQTEDVLLQD